MIVAATGHRPHRIDGYGRRQRAELAGFAREQLRRLRPERVISGMALGWDEAVVLAAHLESIPFVAAVPFEGQERQWPDDAQRRYRAWLERAAEVVIIGQGYSSANMHKRDRWMVDRGDRLLALWDGMVGGGTAKTIMYAEKKGVSVENVWGSWLYRDLLGC